MYAELNEHLPPDRRKVDFQVSFEGRRSIGDLIESLSVPNVEVGLILANGEPVDFSYIVREQDRFSIYPDFRTLKE